MPQIGNGGQDIFYALTFFVCRFSFWGIRHTLDDKARGLPRAVLVKGTKIIEEFLWNDNTLRAGIPVRYVKCP